VALLFIVVVSGSSGGRARDPVSWEKREGSSLPLEGIRQGHSRGHDDGDDDGSCISKSLATANVYIYVVCLHSWTHFWIVYVWKLDVTRQVLFGGGVLAITDLSEITLLYSYSME
jgi:hypothetical protein